MSMQLLIYIYIFSTVLRMKFNDLTRAPLGYSAERAPLGGGADSAPPA